LSAESPFLFLSKYSPPPMQPGPSSPSAKERIAQRIRQNSQNSQTHPPSPVPVPRSVEKKKGKQKEKEESEPQPSLDPTSARSVRSSPIKQPRSTPSSPPKQGRSAPRRRDNGNVNGGNLLSSRSSRSPRGSSSPEQYPVPVSAPRSPGRAAENPFKFIL
jgi:hypothetical protein